MSDGAATQAEDTDEVQRLPPARYSGVLAHPTSFPGAHDIGDLGQGTDDFIEWLAQARQTRWQILPLGPTGYGDSPYAAISAFAGNPLLISLDQLAEDGLLERADLTGGRFPEERVNFQLVTEFKTGRLRQAAWRFHSNGTSAQPLRAEYEQFCRDEAAWLDDFALFVALKNDNGGALWSEWPAPLALREPAAMAEARERLRAEIDTERFIQFIFFRQWRRVKELANTRGIAIIGDIPIFVALDSADAWAHRASFQMDESGQPTVVAGVPPDYFSETGQLWGNPLYDWEQMRADGYRWWIERFRAVFKLVDIARIDHFRGFEAYWAVPHGDETAQNGTWVPGPGQDVFDAVRAELGELPVVAEDLGLITPEVDALRLALGFPGMSVLQFAFGSGADNFYLPHNHTRDTVTYTGTHDNDTTAGWYAEADERTRDHVRRYLGVTGSDIAWDLIRAAWMSTGETAIAPAQDILALGNDARMNLPGEADGNWSWRMRPGALTAQHAERLAQLSELYGRIGPWPRDDGDDGTPDAV